MKTSNGDAQDSQDVLLDPRVYDLNTAQKCAVVLSGVGTFNFRVVNPEQIIVSVLAKDSAKVSIEDLVARYLDELLDQRLRAVVAAETKVERDLILAYAFSNTKLLG